MKSRAWFVIAALAPLVLSSSCSTATTADEPSPSASADPLPPRPREIRMEGIDPCSLGTPEVVSQARVPSEPHPGAQTVPGVEDCSWDRSVLQRPSGSLAVFVATNQDTRNVLAVHGAQVTTVSGFGAVELSDARYGDQFNCGVRVDVAPNQGLWVTYLNTLGDEPGATHELMCQRAHAAAETIMRDLLARTK